jgi:glutathione peroxidase
MSAHTFQFTAIDGRSLPLKSYAGHPVLVVNTASQCGYTPQYAALQSLWQRFRDQGLVVIAVPSNDFGEQEPGTDAEIEAFCTTRFGVDFPVSRKEAVIGEGAHPFFRWIADVAGEGAAPRWNFHKYLIDGAGELVGAWPSRVDPLAPDILGPIEDLVSPGGARKDAPADG